MNENDSDDGAVGGYVDFGVSVSRYARRTRHIAIAAFILAVISLAAHFI